MKITTQEQGDSLKRFIASNYRRSRLSAIDDSDIEIIWDEACAAFNDLQPTEASESA